MRCAAMVAGGPPKPYRWIRKILNSLFGDYFLDYENHYTRLIERAKHRTLDCYTESHHIVPRCMEGTNDVENLVDLTPEEHYLAHLLLVKIHPNHKGLTWAAIQMTYHSNGERNNNKMYGWLRRRHSEAAKRRVGELNGSFGTRWITDGKVAKKINKDDQVPVGWRLGRLIKVKPKNFCSIPGCSIEIKPRQMFCLEHRHLSRRKLGVDPRIVLEMYNSGVELSVILDYGRWKKEQNVTSYLTKNFPDRIKFGPFERTRGIS
jgi:hypothetical protein